MTRWNFSTRELHPRGLRRRWAVYVDGVMVGVKHSRGELIETATYRGFGVTVSEGEFCLLTPAGRCWGGDPEYSYVFDRDRPLCPSCTGRDNVCMECCRNIPRVLALFAKQAESDRLARAGVTRVPFKRFQPEPAAAH